MVPVTPGPAGVAEAGTAAALSESPATAAAARPARTKFLVISNLSTKVAGSITHANASSMGEVTSHDLGR
ncbi:hypothetical protein GCM10010345_67530 [Streptomyces canarius]|uniref:FXSXX-COOH protein n=1 Tax=Streptomyces canarius TaxID=285453 RepID=A0ABQ3D535_9ACTN|nr:hypothetical protein GCM10010345_67530 [Streptomyces canarius]